MAEHLHRPSGHEFIAHMVPDQAGALWLSLLVVLLVGINLERPFDPRNLDLLVAQAPAWFLFGVVDIIEETDQAEWFAYVRLCFILVGAVLVALLIRSLWL